MRIDEHVIHAIDDFAAGKKDAALMHACVALDATSRKLANSKKSSAEIYKHCIRQYWWLVEAFIGAGLNLEETKWTNIKIENGRGKPIPEPDLADIIYHVFRCSHAHGDEVPQSFKLLLASDGSHTWRIGFEDNTLHIPETSIWAILAISVFCSANADITTNTEHFLTWGAETLGWGPHKFDLRFWWGGERALSEILARYPIIRVKLCL